MYTQLGVLTKGTVIEVNVSELGMVTAGGKVVFGKYAQVTNNPENDGCINAVLRALSHNPFIRVKLTMGQLFDALDGIFLLYCISRPLRTPHDDNKAKANHSERPNPRTGSIVPAVHHHVPLQFAIASPYGCFRHATCA